MIVTAKHYLRLLLIGLVIFLAKPAYSFSNIDVVNLDDNQKIALKNHLLIAEYKDNLGFFANPFSYALDSNEVDQIYQCLLIQDGDFYCEDSNLRKVKIELLKSGSNLDLGFVQGFLEDAEKIIRDESSSISKRQANLLALESLSPYLYHFIGEEDVIDDEQAQDADEVKLEKEKEKKKEENPKWPQEMGDNYDPHTKDLGKDKDDRKKYVVTEVNFKTPVFGEKIYDSVVRSGRSSFHATDLPWKAEKPYIAKKGITNDYMKVYPFGGRDLRLFMPTGYVPGPLEGPAVIKPATIGGGYRLQLQDDLKEIDIPLHKAQSKKLSDYLKDIYTRSVGISADELPEKLQIAVIHKFDPNLKSGLKVEKIAKTLADHLAKDYLYSSEARPERDPVDALKAGAFQCDMAAYVMTAVLRDIYKIPSRVVAGYRAKRKNKSNKVHSYLLTPEDGHSWVEVFIDGRWHYFDPTPTKKDKEDEGDKEEQEFSDWGEDDDSADLDEDMELDDVCPAEGCKEGEDGEGKEGERKEGEVETEVDNEDTDKDGGAGEDEDSDDDPYFFPDLDQKLEDVLSDDNEEEDPLKRLAWRDVLMYSLNPFQSSNNVQNKLFVYGNIFKSNKNFKSIVEKGKDIHKKSHASLSDWFATLSNKIFDQKINDTYKGLLRMVEILELYYTVSDNSNVKKLILKVAGHLNSLLTVLDKFNSEIAEDIALTDDFKDNAPELLWRSLSKKYGLSVVGANVPTQNLAIDIRDGKLNNEKLINTLYDYTDFILESSQQPGRTNIKTWMQGSFTRGQDILLLNRLSDWPNAILMKPHLDLIENMQLNTAYLMTNRKQIPIESQQEQNEAERITIVGFDTSGSMVGQLDRFQASLIAAFACRALNDVTPTGRHRHKILLVPFDHEVGEPIEVNNAQDALNLISNYRTWLRNTGGGTDIQNFLLQAMNLIVEAQSKSGSKLDSANIILMSDGESEVDYEVIRKARQSINRDTPLRTMFVALGSTNSALQRFAKDAEEMGMESKDLYLSFSENEINDIVRKSRMIKNRKAFYSLSQPEDISQRDRNKITKIVKDAKERIGQLKQAVSSRLFPTKKPFAHNAILNSKTKSISKSGYQDREIEGWLHMFREWIDHHKIKKDVKLFELIIDDLMVNFEKLLNVKFEDLSYRELGELKHVLGIRKQEH